MNTLVNGLGKLYLIPNVLGETSAEDVLPAKVFRIASELRHFLVEDAKSARKLLKELVPNVDLRSLWMEEVNEHTSKSAIPPLLQPLREGMDMGVISEAGFPCIADPGEEIVREAHRIGSKVIPLSGPSSILLALAASGLPGEDFRFAGYLPVESMLRREKILALEAESKKANSTIIFMETPYRSDAMLKDVLGTCSTETLLSLSSDLTTERELIVTKSIGNWRKNVPMIGKTPTIFILYSKNV